MAILRKPGGKFHEVAFSTAVEIDEVNKRDEFWIELLHGRGQITAVLCLNVEEAATLYDTLAQFLASQDP